MLRDADEILSELATPSRHRADIEELLRQVVNEFDGPAGLAKELFNTYKASPEGGQNRVRVLSDIMRLLGSYGEKVDEDDDISTEDLQAMGRELLNE